MYQYKCRIDRVVDGDTVDVTVMLGFDISFSQRFRIRGIQAADGEKKKLATAHAQSLLKPGDEWIVNTYKDKQDKYGRYLADLERDGISFAHEMLISGLAVPWNGQGAKPEPFCFPADE